MNGVASHITSLTIVYSVVYSGTDQRKHQSSASLAFVRGIHWWPVNSPHKGLVTRKMFPFDDVMMSSIVHKTSWLPDWLTPSLSITSMLISPMLSNRELSLDTFRIVDPIWVWSSTCCMREGVCVLWNWTSFPINCKSSNSFLTFCETFSNAFYWMQALIFGCKPIWSFFVRVPFTRNHHEFKQWLCTKQATNHYLLL